MSNKFWLVFVLLAAVLVGMFAYGVHAGDPANVQKNADNFCFS